MSTASTHPVYDQRVQTLAGEWTTLRPYAGDVLLVVNTASKCGFTPQYADLESLHQQLGPRGLRVLGFPCNQFGQQEPGSNEQIADFCQLNFGVTFPMHSRVDVNGPEAHPLFQHLTRAQPGLLGTTAIKWNFTKFLVDRRGEVIARFASRHRPTAPKIVDAIERALSA